MKRKRRGWSERSAEWFADPPTAPEIGPLPDGTHVPYCGPYCGDTPPHPEELQDTKLGIRYGGLVQGDFTPARTLSPAEIADLEARTKCRP